MQELKELISVVSKHKVKQIEVMGNEAPSTDSKFSQLYELVHNGAVKTDKEALSQLYNGSPDSQEAYLKLKNRLKTRLLNTLFFIDVNQPQFSDIQKAFFTCNKNWLAARTLQSRGSTKVAIKLAETTLREAIKYEFTELVIYLSKMLFWHYSIVDGNNKKYNYYMDIYDRAQLDLVAETKAERYYTEITLQYASSQAKADNYIQKLNQYSNDLQANYSHVQTFRFLRISYLLHIIRHEIQHDFEEAINKCNEAILAISSKPYNSKGALFSFSLRLLSCLIQVERYSEAEELAIKYADELPSGSANWYVVQYYHFLLLTHSKQFQKAHDLLIQAITNKNFESQYPGRKQLWLVNHAYVFFLRQIGKVKQAQGDSKLTFRLYKFLNDIPIYSKDKRGINISVLIVHVLILLHQKKYSEIIDRVDALNQYCHRYLRRDDTFRSNCFIKMLLQMAKADFNRIRTERYANKYWTLLIDNPLNITDQGIEVEVIPYETLWQIVLELLN